MIDQPDPTPSDGSSGGAPLAIPRAILDAMIAHCLRDAPLEACGLLSGHPDRVSSIHPLLNAARSETRYVADSVELIRAVRAIREADAEILAIYHSHPRWKAIPSQTDLRENYYQDVPRIIVSLLDDPADVKIWRFSAESYEELAWEVLD